MRPRSTTAVKVQPMPLSLLSRRACEKIQLLSALSTVAPARRTSMVSGRSQNPSRKPRTAVSAATRPPLAPPMPSAIAAMMSRRGFGNSMPKTAPAKSSLRSRGPVSEAKPMLALTAGDPSAIAAVPAIMRGCWRRPALQMLRRRLGRDECRRRHRGRGVNCPACNDHKGNSRRCSRPRPQ